MRRERKELNHKAEDLYTEVKTIIDTFAERHPLPDRDLVEIDAAKRAVVNTSVILALSSVLHTHQEKVVKILAEKTEGLEADAELRTAITEGIKLAGDEFKTVLVGVLKVQLSTYDE